MDLPYPSHHDVNLTSNINRIDKLRRSIKLSHNQLPPPFVQQLRKSQKQKIIKFLTFDYGFNLSSFIEKNSIRLDAQVGTPGSLWNSLHFACKFNALECLQYLLKEQYNHFPQEYEQFVNLKTIEGYTALVICIINQSNQALSLLLSFGGVDIHLIDSKKMTAYEVAINYNNENAIKMLMNYQHQSKKSKKLNKNKLSQDIVFTKRQNGCCSDLLGYLLNCLSFGSYPIQSKISGVQSNLNKQFDLNKNEKKKNLLLSKDGYIDVVEIGKQEDEQDYQITWKNIQEIISNKKFPLYDSYNPFDICQNNLVIKNNLILMQCISQHPWLVRKLVQSYKNRSNFYTVNLFINYQQVKISVDHHVPFLKDRSQPMFISDQNQMWPMILQKGLAKVHNSYFNLQQVSPKVLIQQMTGFPTFQLDLQFLSTTSSANKIIHLLEDLTKKGFLFLLQGKQGSSLSNEGRVDCFSVLNFFDKGDKKLILVNCPFVDERWRQKQKYEILALKLIKSHINKHNQMCVWIDEERITQYFSKIIVSTTLPNYQRTCVKIKLAANQFFFKFKIDKQRQQNVIMQLVDLDSKQVVQIQQIRGYVNQGMANIQFKNGVEDQNYSYGIKHIANAPGQYLCYAKFPDSQNFASSPPSSSSLNQVKKKREKHTNFMLIFWTIDSIQPIHLDQMLGPIQYLQCYKLNMIKYCQEAQTFQMEVISGHAMIIVKESPQTRTVYMDCPIQQLDIVEGSLTQETKVQLVKEQMSGYSGEVFFYCVLRNVDQYLIKQYQQEKRINFLSEAK